jgi:hypothetical protein
MRVTFCGACLRLWQARVPTVINIPTHSKADHDDKASYLRKVGTRYFTCLEIAHPETAFWLSMAPRS